MLKIYLFSVILCFGALGSNVFCRDRLLVNLLDRDTLIIDSDTIYVEQEQVQLPEDSLPAGAVNRTKLRVHPWSLGVSSGINLTHTNVQPNSGDLLPLNAFMGIPYKPQVNLAVGIDLGYRFLTIPVNRGAIELSVMTAYNLNRTRIGYAQIDNPSDLNKDSLLFFKEDAGELVLGYFTITEPPFIGEADSSYLYLTKSVLDFRSHDVTAKLRATISRGPRRMRFFFETGIVRRFVKLNNPRGDLFFVSENGRYQVLSAGRISGRNLIVPHFAIGAEKKLNTNGESSEHYFILGGSIQTSFPSAAFYEDQWMNVEIRNSAAFLFARYCF